MIGTKFKKTGHVTLITTLLGMVCHRRLGCDTVYMHAKCFRFQLQQFLRYHWRRQNLTWVT